MLSPRGLTHEMLRPWERSPNWQGPQTATVQVKARWAAGGNFLAGPAMSRVLAVGGPGVNGWAVTTGRLATSGRRRRHRSGRRGRGRGRSFTRGLSACRHLGPSVIGVGACDGRGECEQAGSNEGYDFAVHVMFPCYWPLQGTCRIEPAAHAAVVSLPFKRPGVRPSTWRLHPPVAARWKSWTVKFPGRSPREIPTRRRSCSRRVPSVANHRANESTESDSRNRSPCCLGLNEGIA